jgi:hypothetical protein
MTTIEVETEPKVAPDETPTEEPLKWPDWCPKQGDEIVRRIRKNV